MAVCDLHSVLLWLGLWLTCSNSAMLSPTLPPGVTPYPPHNPATMLETRLPYRLGVTWKSEQKG